MIHHKMGRVKLEFLRTLHHSTNQIFFKSIGKNPIYSVNFFFHLELYNYDQKNVFRNYVEIMFYSLIVNNCQNKKWPEIKYIVPT